MLKILRQKSKNKKEAYTKSLDDEKKVNAAIAKKVAEKKAALAAEKAAAETVENTETPSEEVPAEA